jgi:hypothetical protein
VKFFLYSGARIGTGCRLKVKDFHQDGDEATITLHEKGDKHRRIGLHFAAAQAISEYTEKAGLTKGPLFRARRHSRKMELGEKPIGLVTMYRLLQGYLARLPGSMREEEVAGEGGGGRGRRWGRAEGQAVRLHAALAAGDDGDAAAGGRCGHHQGEGPAGSPARDDDADLRQAAAEPEGRGLARRADLSPLPRCGP